MEFPATESKRVSEWWGFAKADTRKRCRLPHLAFPPGECPWKVLLTEPRDGSYPSIAIEAQEQP